jgi:hypothetical protein
MCLDEGTQGADIHIGLTLQLGNRGLVDTQDLREARLRQRAGFAKLAQGHLSHNLFVPGIGPSLLLGGHSCLEFLEILGHELTWPHPIQCLIIGIM